MNAAASSPANSINLVSITDNHSDLQNAALGTTNCLEKLAYLRLIKWLPVTAVSCTALPLLLHVLGAEISSSVHAKDYNHSNLMEHRLKVLRTAMETYQFQYEGVDWISDTINRVITLARAGSISTAGASLQSSMGGKDWTGMFIFPPDWYLWLAFTVDVALSKGRLPEEQDFFRSIRELIQAELGQFKDHPTQLRNKSRASSDNEATQALGWQQGDSPVAGYAATPSGLTQLVTEPSYLITDVADPAWEKRLFRGPEQTGESMGSKYSGECTTHTSTIDEISVAKNEAPAISELDIFTLFSDEGLDGNGEFSVGFGSPAGCA